MQLDGLAEPSRPAVVEQVHPAALRRRRETHAPERRRPPLGRERDSLGVAVVELGPHVVEQEVGVGMELDLVERPDRRGAGAQRGHVAAGAPGLREQGLARHDIGGGGVSPRRGAQRLEIEDHRAHGARADFRIGHVVARKAADLAVEEILRNEVTRQPHVLVVGRDRLMQQVDRHTLLPEASDELASDRDAAGGAALVRDGVERRDLDDQVALVQELHPPRNPVAIEIVGIGKAKERRVVHRLQQAEAGDAGRGEHRDPGDTLGDDLRDVALNRTVLDLRSALRPHRIEDPVHHAAETGEVEHRVALAVADVAGPAGARHEHRPGPLARAEGAIELLVTLREDRSLRGGQALDRPVEHLVVGRCGREQRVAPSHERQGDEECGVTQLHGQTPHGNPTQESHSPNVVTSSQPFSPMMRTATVIIAAFRPIPRMALTFGLP